MWTKVYQQEVGTGTQFKEQGVDKNEESSSERKGKVGGASSWRRRQSGTWNII